MSTLKTRISAVRRLQTMFRSLRYRNFRLFFSGQSISLIGTWIQYVAMSWLVYRLTNSAFLLGVVAFSSQIPAFLLSPFTGVIADRHNRHRILILTQVVSMLQAFLLALLTFAGVIAVWQIVILGVVLGCVNSIDIPARHSFIIDMVEKKELLGNAIVLNSFVFNLARLIGPSLAGLLIGFVGEGSCFFINGLSFLAVIAALLAMDFKLRPGVLRPQAASLLAHIKEGWVYAFSFPPIRSILLFLSVVSLMGMSYGVLMPIFARDVLHGGPHTFGFLMAAAGVGALTGTVYLASRQSIMQLSKLLPAASLIFGLGIIAFSCSRSLWLSLLMLFIAGFGIMVQMALSNTILQVIVEDDKRGRVMSLYSMAFMGMAPVGSLLAGALASHFGAGRTLAFSGLVCVAAAVIFASRIKVLQGMLHPIYRRMGVIPEIASGLGTAAELTAPPEE